MALITLIRRRGAPGGRRVAVVLAALGIFGASLFFGDSMITPAISVLSAVEGLKVVEPSLESAGRADHGGDHRGVVRVPAGRHGGRRSAVRSGDDRVVPGDRRVRNPGIVGHPEILKALSPTYALEFLVGHFSIAFFALAAVVLAVTGAEALYADMGHFGRPAITRAWLILVFPACILSYMGQGALILADPDQHQQPVLPARPGVGAAAAGPAGDRRDGHRVPGGDHRRVLRRVAGGSARVSAEAADRAHLGGDDRPDLRPVDQLAADDLGAHAGVRLPELGGAGLRLRYGGDGHDHDHDTAVLLRRPTAVGRPVVGGDPRRRPRCCSSMVCSSPPT